MWLRRELIFWSFWSYLDRWIWLNILLRHASQIFIFNFFLRFPSVQNHFLFVILTVLFGIYRFILFLFTVSRNLWFFYNMNYFLFRIIFALSNFWVQILIVLNQIRIMYILNIFLFIFNIRAISIYNLYSNIFRSKTFFHFILALLNNFFSLFLVF